MGIKIDANTGKWEIVEDPIQEIDNLPTQPPSIEDRISAVENAILNLMG